MNIVCIGGGPAGLYFGLLMKLKNPAHQITVVEQNKPYDTFGWGVVFSDATMDTMRVWDPVTAAEIAQSFNHWDDISLEFKGEVLRSGGHGFVGAPARVTPRHAHAQRVIVGHQRARVQAGGDRDLQFVGERDHFRAGQ